MYMYHCASGSTNVLIRFTILHLAVPHIGLKERCCVKQLDQAAYELPRTPAPISYLCPETIGTSGSESSPGRAVFSI